MDMYFWIHLVLALLLAVYFLYRYLKKDRLTYQLLFVFWLPTTLLTYISDHIAYRVVLAVFQLLMFLLVIYFMFRKTPPQTDSSKEDSPPEGDREE